MLPLLHTIGRVAGKHGFHGYLVLHFNSEIFAKAINQGDFLFVSIDGKGVPFLIERFNPKSGIVKLADVENEIFASELEGLEILTEKPMDMAEDQKFNGESWIGLKLFDIQNNSIGKIVKIEEYPAGLMLLVLNETREILIPLVEEWILEISEKDGILVMDIPNGLVDL